MPLSSRRPAKLPPRYRLMLFQKPAGVWRPTRADVQADAIVAGVADYDPAIGVVFLTVPAWVQESAGAPVPARPTDLRPAPRRPFTRRRR